MAVAYKFTRDEMTVDQSLGYPRAYAKLCKDTNLSPYCHGPPFTFTPYSLHAHEATRARELDDLFPIHDPHTKATAKPRIYISLLWKQLNHLGNAGFDPAMFRVDPYGNVLYFHADSASPLAWDVDHWFPCSRGGLTVPSNLRILQWQVCKRKHNQLEILVPWWDLQLGISINQFLSIFAASNSDFRHRAFRLLFSGGENEELNDVQTVESHNFPLPYMESKDQLGLAPAAVVRTRTDSYGSSCSTLRSLEINRQPRPSTPVIAPARKLRNCGSKENDMPDMVTNPYQALVMARDSLKNREETNKKKAEIQRLDDEVDELKLKNEEEKLTIQELELALFKRRRRAEKCRRLAETQSSYRSMLEKMIRNTMHQSVVYKEQVRLNQAATNALMARLEAQMAICKSAEKELEKRFNQRDVLERQVRPEWEVRKRSRSDDDDGVCENQDDRTLIYLPRSIDTRTPQHKELKEFLEEEHKLSEEEKEELDGLLRLTAGHENMGDDVEPEVSLMEGTSQMVDIPDIKFPFAEEEEVEEDEESRKERGKGNVEKWLQMMLGDMEEGDEHSPPQVTQEPESSKTDEIIRMLNEKYPQKEIKVLKLPSSEQTNRGKDMEINEGRRPRSASTPRRSISSEVSDGRKSFGRNHGKDRVQINADRGLKSSVSTSRRSLSSEVGEKRKSIDTQHGKDHVDINEVRGLRSVGTPRRSVSSEVGEGRKSFDKSKAKWDRSSEKEVVGRSESARSFRRIPSSPSLILNMRKGVDCIRKKPLVLEDDDEYGDENQPANVNFLKSSIKSIKKAVKV